MEWKRHLSSKVFCKHNVPKGIVYKQRYGIAFMPNICKGFLMHVTYSFCCLVLQKIEVQHQINDLTLQQQEEIKLQIDKIQTSFNSLKVKLAKLKKEKLPSKFEQPQFYKNIETVDTLSRGNAYLTVLNFVKTTSEQIDANLENGTC